MVALMGALLFAIGAFFGYYFFGSFEAGLVIAAIIWLFMWLTAYYGGDGILLSMNRARKIEKKDHPRLFNVVEEMTIASGLPKMPDIYIIDDPALNAFATGRDINHTSVAITSGLLEKLNRDELQGVIAHELAHIKNRDVLLMVILAVMVGAIVLISQSATRMMFWGGMAGGGGRRKSRDSGGGGIQIIILLLGVILMILAPIFAQLIYLALSRRREYLSDASSALYTRYPDGLASALEKLATSNVKVATANKATAPMYIADPFQKRALSAAELGSTHPPLADRVRILRSMGGASLADYAKAYSQMHKGAGILPQSAVTAAGTLGLRAAQPEKAGEEARVERARETSDLMWKMNEYKTLDCDCGVKLRIPPDFKGESVRCPRCGDVHSVKEAN